MTNPTDATKALRTVIRQFTQVQAQDDAERADFKKHKATFDTNRDDRTRKQLATAFSIAREYMLNEDEPEKMAAYVAELRVANIPLAADGEHEFGPFVKLLWGTNPSATKYKYVLRHLHENCGTLEEAVVCLENQTINYMRAEDIADHATAVNPDDKEAEEEWKDSFLARRPAVRNVEVPDLREDEQFVAEEGYAMAAVTYQDGELVIARIIPRSGEVARNHVTSLVQKLRKAEGAAKKKAERKEAAATTSKPATGTKGRRKARRVAQSEQTQSA
jgi:hypothetical protein